MPDTTSDRQTNRPAPHLPLWPEVPPASSPYDSFVPWLEPYLLEGEETRGAVIVFPGGGYAGRAPHEQEPVARRFNAAGLHAFVLQYRVAPHRHPAPLLDAARALRMVRHSAAQWQVDPQHIAVCGFSAGGHLAASLGVHYALPEARAVGDNIDAVSARPDALILSYPVISAGKHAHQGSFANLLGPEPAKATRKLMSLHKQVSANTPPAFLWHTADDAGVPVENSLLFARALSRHEVPFELHVYPRGAHGLGLAEEHPHIATWTALCCEWLHGLGF